MTKALSITNLTFSYKSWTARQAHTLFENLSFDIEEGSKTLLLAPFNQGKTTLAKIMCRVCPKYFPGEMKGSVCFYERDISVLEPWQLISVCTYVSQNPQELFVANSVEEEIAFPLESMGLSREEMHRRVQEALRTWGLEALKTSSAQELSGGERKRVLLAVMQAIDARFWLLDEAFDDLDEHWRLILKQLIKETGKTVLVFASRYLSTFDDLFDRMLLLEDKQVKSYEPEALLPRFAVLCKDTLPNPLQAQVLDLHHTHRVTADRLRIERRRVSTISAGTFHLNVDDFSLQSGQLVTLVAPNGSGKSSFSRCLCGLDDSLEGKISFDGRPQDSKELSKKIGYLFQNPDLQIFLPTVADELAWSMRHLGRSRQGEIASCAKLFELDLDDTPTTMSYPQRKALQAAVYYLLDRPFYILDELDSALTYHTALSIIARLRRNGAGILLITHDRQFANKVGQQSYTIKEGRLLRV